MKKSKHILHGIEFLFLFGLNGVMLWFFRGYFNVVIGVAMLILFCGAVISVHRVKRHLAIKIHMPDISMSKNTEFLTKISVTNTSMFPLLNARLDLKVGNAFMDEPAKMSLIVPIKARGIINVELPIRAQHVGVLEVYVEGIVLEDWLGLHSVRKNMEVKEELYVMPEGVWEEALDINAYQSGMEEVEESKLTGNDFSDVSQVREYIPGDAMKNIHWKLSAKKEQMMVKERLRMSTGKLLLVLVVERNEPAQVDETIERLYGLGKELLHQNTPITLFWWSEKMGEICEGTAQSLEEWKNIMLQVFFHHAGNGYVEEHFRTMHPERGYVLVDKDGIYQREV